MLLLQFLICIIIHAYGPNGINLRNIKLCETFCIVFCHTHTPIPFLPLRIRKIKVLFVCTCVCACIGNFFIVFFLTSTVFVTSHISPAEQLKCCSTFVARKYSKLHLFMKKWSNPIKTIKAKMMDEL